MSDTIPPLPAEILVIEGPDAGQFMHGQFTSNVLELREGQWQFSAWLDAAGRVRALFHLARVTDERWVVLLRGGRADEMRSELSRFVLRARVRLQAQTAGTLAIAPMAALHVANEDGGELMLGCGNHAIASGAIARCDDGLRKIQIRAGWPWLSDGALGQYTAASLGLHQLGAIALDKGCYPGQEIVARLHYRGGNKRRLCRVILSQDVGADARLRRVADEAEMHVLDVMRDGSEFRGLAVAHEALIAGSQDDHQSLCTDGTRIRIVESWDE